MDRFTYTSFGKCIIAGEHTVLRGGDALVFPVIEKNMLFTYSNNGEDSLVVDFHGSAGKELQMVFFSLLEEALKKINVQRSQVKGILKIESNLPLGAGLGASAAICVGVTKWFSYLGYVENSNIFNFARELENMFHGESSGADIAVSLAGAPILFNKEKGFQKFQPKWFPNWYLTYCGKRGVTSECVKKVQDLSTENPNRSKEIDSEMMKSVGEAVEALSKDISEGQPLLVQSLSRAKRCFEAWELADGILEDKMAELENNGAIAVKPTGSGGGGFVLHFWNENDHPSNRDSIPLHPDR